MTVSTRDTSTAPPLTVRSAIRSQPSLAGVPVSVVFLWLGLRVAGGEVPFRRWLGSVWTAPHGRRRAQETGDA